jgi:hypothetical protein
MDNASLILQTLDEHLDHRVRLILYGPTQLNEAFATVIIPDLVELRDAFDRAKPVILKIAKQISNG